MTARIASLLWVCCLPVGLCAAEPANPALDAMQGTWTVLTFTSNGEEVPASTIVAWKRTVTGKHVVWKDGDLVLVETDFEIDPSKSPMTLDSTIATGDAKGQTMLAIYEFKDDVLRVCFAPPGEPRPVVFSAAAGTDALMYTCQRLKP
ncbi:MAG: TIGR03067 domain-containing protein [Pirellulales bacterium]